MTNDDIALAHRLAEAAGEAIRPYFRSRFDIDQKGDASPVTQADRAAEEAMRKILSTERAADGIIGEEFGIEREDASRIWVLDPIDGTRSFICGRPIFGTLIALLEDGIPVLGVIDQPVIGERWIGAKGLPTELNGSPVRTRKCGRIDAAQVATTSPYLFTGPGERERFELIANKASNLVLGGDCYSYGLLAMGQLDLVIETQLQLYDFAALVPVVEGAGGIVRDWSGQPLNKNSDGRLIACGDQGLMNEILPLLS